ncbi:MAG TPA: methionyl-tRNA formyltransferase [Rhodospirillaceae bacterium]|nr:methionyl-tRNA formyltransferase [Rhodospirillaceae bacterium]
MRIAFLGTPDFSVPALDSLIAADHEVVCVYTQPPRRAGRGRGLRRAPVHDHADALGLSVRTPETLRDSDEQAAFVALNLDAAVVVAYGLILPKTILEAPFHGCINIHASLLPRWRGAAPIQRAIMAGDSETGVTIMQMDTGLDTGPALLHDVLPITPATNSGMLHDSLSEMGARLIVSALDGIGVGELQAVSQPVTGQSYAAKIESDEERIDWSRPACALDCHVRALAPFPGAWFEHEGVRIKVLEAEIVSGNGPSGRVLDDLLTVACGEGALRPLTVQHAGKAVMAAADYLRGRPVAKGTVFA